MFPSSYHQPITFVMPDISPKIKIAESPKSPIVVLRRQDCSWESKPVDESSEEDDEDDDDEEEEVYFSMHATPPFLKTSPLSIPLSSLAPPFPPQPCSPFPLCLNTIPTHSADQNLSKELSMKICILLSDTVRILAVLFFYACLCSIFVVFW